jgi:hypothetical protein
MQVKVMDWTQTSIFALQTILQTYELNSKV